ncbi:plasmid partition protein ParG [Caldinitratiruptor microaerophilus]|uniref:Uncharacterized protein n=1 Tax=Caldinitratiruptor microaerophilus TaxID=671077 RepID=A0AA35G5L4_9FIRM|nr:plasmid partition protein ParG [Caldinitratiruptor microaerophilus]BDG59641.1 hypothetical protein caldi_07310 [Caldinitratiruptor microaerophilus]
MEKRRGIVVRIDEELHRRYKALCAEEGITIQDDLERYILRRLHEAGRLPKDEPPR